MTELRARMIEDLKLAGYAERTQKAYVAVVRQLAAHYRRSPDRLDEKELRRYFIYLRDERKLASGSLTVAHCGIRFFYEKTLQKRWTFLDFVKPPRGRKLPVVLSRKELHAVLRCVEVPAYRVCLSLAYACGMRAGSGSRRLHGWRRRTSIGSGSCSMPEGRASGIGTSRSPSQ